MSGLYYNSQNCCLLSSTRAASDLEINIALFYRKYLNQITNCLIIRNTLSTFLFGVLKYKLTNSKFVAHYSIPIL